MLKTTAFSEQMLDAGYLILDNLQ